MVIKLVFRKYGMIFLILFLGFVLRLWLSPIGFHWDILSIAYWGEWIHHFGTRGFYSNNVWVYSWPTQPPLVNLLYAYCHILYVQLLEFFRWASSYVLPHLAPGHMLWWFDFVKWFDSAQYPESYLKIGYLMTIKLLGELADVFIALVLYLTARKENKKWALILAAIYLFSPFSFYLSSLWGQYDQISFLFMLISFLAILKNKSVLAPALFAISFSLKPTSLIFIPLFLWIYFLKKPKTWEILVGGIIALIALILPTWFFSNRNFFDFVSNDLISKIFYKADFRLTTNAFNFWRIFVANRPEAQTWPFLFIPANIWGLSVFFILHAISFILPKQKSFKTFFASLFLIGTGGWMFLTTMLDRYVFAGIVAGLFLCIYERKLLKYWLILSLIFWINQFHGFWFPPLFKPLQNLLMFNDEIFTRVLAIANVAVFLRMAQLIISGMISEGIWKQTKALFIKFNH